MLKGKSAQDKIFGANAAAVAAAAKYGADKVTNATIGAILDEDEKLVTRRSSDLKAISPLLLLPVVQALSIILSGTIWMQVKPR